VFSDQKTSEMALDCDELLKIWVVKLGFFAF
jgi:hypothetical protein